MKGVPGGTNVPGTISSPKTETIQILRHLVTSHVRRHTSAPGGNQKNKQSHARRHTSAPGGNQKNKQSHVRRHTSAPGGNQITDGILPKPGNILSSNGNVSSTLPKPEKIRSHAIQKILVRDYYQVAEATNFGKIRGESRDSLALLSLGFAMPSSFHGRWPFLAIFPMGNTFKPALFHAQVSSILDGNNSKSALFHAQTSSTEFGHILGQSPWASPGCRRSALWAAGI